MRILKIREWKVFVKNEEEVIFTAYLGKQKVVDPNVLIHIEGLLREQLRKEIEAANQDLRDFYEIP